MSMTEDVTSDAPPLAPTVAPLSENLRAVLDRLASSGYRHVQLSAAEPGLRPRDLDRSARRDLLATMRRREIEPAGLDLWIPAEHFTDRAHCDRAVSAVLAAIEMAADLGRCSLSLALPAPSHRDGADAKAPSAVDCDQLVETIREAAHRHGVPVADHAIPPAARDHDELFGIGIDPAAHLAGGGDPVQAVHEHADRLISARLVDMLTTGMRGPVGGAGGRGGRLDVTGYKIALTVAGYRRPVVVDTRQWADPWAGLAQSARVWADSTPPAGGGGPMG